MSRARPRVAPEAEPAYSDPVVSRREAGRGEAVWKGHHGLFLQMRSRYNAKPFRGRGSFGTSQFRHCPRDAVRKIAIREG